MDAPFHSTGKRDYLRYSSDAGQDDGERACEVQDAEPDDEERDAGLDDGERACEAQDDGERDAARRDEDREAGAEVPLPQ